MQFCHKLGSGDLRKNQLILSSKEDLTIIHDQLILSSNNYYIYELKSTTTITLRHEIQVPRYRLALIRNVIPSKYMLHTVD